MEHSVEAYLQRQSTDALQQILREMREKEPTASVCYYVELVTDLLRERGAFPQDEN